MKKKEQAKGAGRTSRRGFTKAVAAALVAAPVAAVAARDAQQPSTPPEPKAPPNPQPTPSPSPTASPSPTPQPPSPVAEAYAEAAKARFGKQLSDEEFARVRRDLAGNVRTSERLATFKLKNSDEPDFIFIA
ncbi:MAG TPA: hypothetical protein VFX96_07310 [Pyrinomonadaceae bacterium]|nr:hypothetical protein [Pyrinomonadaceae bacterium]